MELNEDGFLEELLSLGRETWEANPGEINDFFTTSWEFNGFDGNPAPPPILSTTPFECFSLPIKPDLDCSLNELYGPFDPKFTTPSMVDDVSTYHNHEKLEPPSFPSLEDYSMSVVEDEEPSLQADNNVQSLESQAACKVEMAQSMEIPDFNMGLCTEKKRKKKLDGQPSKNLMAERRRRKRLNDRLSMLRSVVPKISKMDRTSILGDTIDYMKELLERINNLQDETDVNSSELKGNSIFKDLKPTDVLVRTSPKFDVERRKVDTRVEICCTGRPGLLLSTMTTLEALGLEIQQCVISCFNDFSLHASCSEKLEQRTLVSSEDIKQALFRNAGYGGRCL